MIPYLMLNLIVISSAIIFAMSRESATSIHFKKIYLAFIGIVLVVFAGFRGDFTSDYRNYEYLFNFYNQFNFNQLLNYQFGQEFGYVFLNWLLGRFTDNVVWLMIITSIVIVNLYFREIKKTSDNVWLSVLLFVTIGQYYISFNLTRQIVAVAILFSGSSFLYDKKTLKYCSVVLLATLFHRTSLIMIPFYFVLNFKFNYKKLFLILCGLLFVSNYIDTILGFLQQYFYSHYLDSSYGMTGFSYKNVVLPLAILVFVINSKHIKKIKNNNKINVWYNATVFYAFFSFLGLNIQMLERLSHYFAPYVLLIIPAVINEQKNKDIRITYIFMIIVGSIMYNYITLSGTGFNPYYLIWSSR